MMVNIVVMNCSLVPMLGHSVTECLGGLTNVVHVAISAGIIGTYKLVDYIGFGFMFTFRGGVIAH